MFLYNFFQGTQIGVSFYCIALSLFVMDLHINYICTYKMLLPETIRMPLLVRLLSCFFLYIMLLSTLDRVINTAVNSNLFII